MSALGGCVKEQKGSEIIVNKLSTIVDRLRAVSIDFYGMANRTCGSVPECGKTDNKAISEGSLEANLTRLLDELDAEVSGISESFNRLNRFL